MFLSIHSERFSPRDIIHISQLLQKGTVGIVPTDTSYSLVGLFDQAAAIEKIRQVKNLSQKDHLTLMCHNLKSIADYAIIDNAQYRLLKQFIPGPFAFILQASKSIPKKMAHSGRKTIGVRVPESRLLSAIIEEVNSPLVSSTLTIDQTVVQDSDEFSDWFARGVDWAIDGGYVPGYATTVVDLTTKPPVLIRQGLGQINDLDK